MELELSLNTATVRRQWNLRQAIEGCARHRITAICPWRDQVSELGLEEAAKLIKGHELKVTGLCRGGFFPRGSKPEQRDALKDNRRAVDEAVQLGAACLVLVVGGMPPGSKDIAGARKQVKDGIAELLDYSRANQMPLAIEPMHPMYAADRGCVNTMAEANDLCDDLGEGIGIAVDVYHVWWDRNLAKEIKRAGRHRLLAFHVCDWLAPTTDLLTDRGMMGDGVIDIATIRGWIQEAGYNGTLEVEIFSEHWWNCNPDDVLATLIERSKTSV